MDFIQSKFFILILSVVAMTSSDKKVLFDFEKLGSAGPWYVVNDGVMGGLSQSNMEIGDGQASFRGTVSLENNGGFASVRTKVSEMDLSSFDGFQLKVKGDGKTYKFRVRTTQRFDGVAYSVNFKTKANEWQTHTLDKEQFEPVFRGRRVIDAPPLDMASVQQLGFLIGDYQKGPFHLKIAQIEVFKQP